MRMLCKIRLLYAAVFILAAENCYSLDVMNGYSIYPFGGTIHFNRSDNKSNDGSLSYLAASKSYVNNHWSFENGVGTFIDTFNLRSYIAFSDISHDEYKLGIVTPMLNIHCSYKGYSHSTTDRKVQCYPAVKFRIGQSSGLFANITPIPKIKGLTYGQIAFELGYKF